MIHFNTLSTLCHQAIFDKLPITDLLRLTRVSHYWQFELQFNARKRKSLIVLQGKSPLRLISTECQFEAPLIAHRINMDGSRMTQNPVAEQDQLKCRNFTASIVRTIVETFPNIKTLFVAQDRTTIRFNSAVALLLEQYSSKLIKLKLYFNYNYTNQLHIVPPQEAVESVEKIIRHFNSLSALEHLTLYFNTYTDPYDYVYDEEEEENSMLNPTIQDLEFLSRIREFYCYESNLSRVWHQALEKYHQQKGSLLTRIGLSEFNWIQDHPVDYAQWMHYANRITHYHFEFLDLCPEYMKDLAHFPSLASITITYGQYEYFGSIAQLSHYLSPLTKLVNVTFELFESILEKPSYDEDEEVIRKTKISSVKALDLVFAKKIDPPDVQLPKYHPKIVAITSVFPNLCSIRIKERVWNDSWENYGQPNLLEQPAMEYLSLLRHSIAKPSMCIDYSNQLLD